MDVIVAYLETMFSPYPATPRLEEAKSELRAMMEDKYTELLANGRSHNEAVGQVITEFGNLDELAPVLGISAELRGDTTPPGVPATGQPGEPVRPNQVGPGNPGAPTGTGTGMPPYLPESTSSPTSPALPIQPAVTLEEAQAFASARHRTRWSLATAVALFVISPAALIVLSTMAEGPRPLLPDNAATAIGLTVLLLLVVAGVSLLIRRSQQLAPFRRLDEGEFTRDPAVSAWAQQLSGQFASSRTTALITAVALWILSAVPVILGGILSEGRSLWAESAAGAGVGLTLATVAAGLLIYLPASWAHSVAEVLTGEGDAPSGQPATSGSPLVGAFAAVYWPLLTAIFLAWGLIWDAWDRAWIVWPVGALVFAALAGGLGAWESARRR